MNSDGCESSGETAPKTGGGNRYSNSILYRPVSPVRSCTIVPKRFLNYGSDNNSAAENIVEPSHLNFVVDLQREAVLQQRPEHGLELTLC